MKQLNLLSTIVFIAIAIPILLLAPLIRQDTPAQQIVYANPVQMSHFSMAPENNTEFVENTTDKQENYAQKTVNSSSSQSQKHISTLKSPDLQPISNNTNTQALSLDTIELKKPSKRINVIDWLFS